MNLTDGSEPLPKVAAACQTGIGRKAQAARVFASELIPSQLRYLQTLTEIGTKKNSTIIFPLPIDMLRTLVVGDKKPA